MLCEILSGESSVVVGGKVCHAYSSILLINEIGQGTIRQLETIEKVYSPSRKVY